MNSVLVGGCCESKYIITKKEQKKLRKYLITVANKNKNLDAEEGSFKASKVGLKCGSVLV